jgi:hypothetical protein
MARGALFVVLLMGGMLPAAAQAPAADPWYGTWRLDPALGTERPAPSPYKRVTLTLAPWQDGLQVVYDMVGTRGGVTHIEWRGRFDGRDYPVQGVDAAMTHAYRRIGPRSYEITVKVEGVPVAAATTTVSPDGDRLTVHTKERGRSGEVVNSAAIYHRLGTGLTAP